MPGRLRPRRRKNHHMRRFREDLRDGLDYVGPTDRFVTTVVVGTVLLNFGYLLFPVVFLMGYFARVLASRAVGVDRPPGFVDWRPLAVTGAKATLTAVVYVGAPTLALEALFGSLLGTDSLSILLATTGDLLTATGVEAVLAFLDRAAAALDPAALPSVVALGIVFYLFPAVLAHFATAEEWKVRDVLDADVLYAVVPFAVRWRYLRAWLVAAGFSLAGVVAVLLPGLFPLLEGYESNALGLFAIFSYNLLLLVGYALFFACQVAAYAVVGRAWADAHPDREPPAAGTRSGLEYTLSEWTDGPPADPDGLRGALRYARRTVAAPRTLLVGGFVVLLGDVFFPVVLLGGYFGRVLRSTMDGGAGGPRFGDWANLTAVGSRMLAAWTLVLALPVALVTWLITRPRLEAVVVTAFGSLFGGIAVAPMRVVVADVVPGVGVDALPAPPATLGPVALLVVVVPVLYLLPASLSLVAERRSTRAAVARPVARLVRSRAYLRRWVTAIALAVAGWAPLVAVVVLVPVRETAAPGSTTLPLGGLAGTGSGFSSPLSFGVLPLRTVAAPRTIPVHAALLAAGVAFFFFQVAAFAVVGRVRRELPGEPAVVAARSDDGGSATWRRRGGLAGLVGGALYVAYGLNVLPRYTTQGISDAIPLRVYYYLAIVYLVLWVGLLPAVYTTHLAGIGAFAAREGAERGLGERLGVAVIGYGLLLELATMTMSQWLYPAYTLWNAGELNFVGLLDYALTPMRDIMPAWWRLHVIGLLVVAAGSLLFGTSLVRSSGRRRVVGALFVASAVVPVGHYLLYLLDVVLVVTASLPLGFLLFGAAMALLGYETWRDTR